MKSNYIYFEEIKKTKRRVGILRKALSTKETYHPKYHLLIQRIREAEIDHNYCLFYPIDKEYEGLLSYRQDEVSGSDIEDDGGELGKLRRPKPALWRLVQQCTKEGRLEALRDGGLGESYSADDLRPSLHADIEPISPAATSNQQDLSGDTSVHVATPKPPDVHDGQGFSGNSNFGRDSAYDTTLKSPDQSQQSDHEPDLDQDQDSGSDGGVVLNLQSSEHESGEISEDVSQGPENREMGETTLDKSDGELHENKKDNDEEDDDDGGNAMLDYAKSDVVNEWRKPSEYTTDIPSHHRRTLAELGLEELKAQLRYFHIAKRPGDVKGDTLVRCLICAEESHMADACNKLLCTCGIEGIHFSQQCPLVWKCHHCQELGHDIRRCPYKTDAPTTANRPCDLCHRDGHYTSDCELLWRTTGLSWESGLVNESVRLSCHECGNSGHLGNDCPTRRPGKPSGTSTWSSDPTGQFTIKAQGEMTIKGRAQKQNRFTIGDSDDEEANFYHPRVPGPARKGQIRIMTGGNSNHANRDSGAYTRNDQPNRNDNNRTIRGGGLWANTRNNEYRNDPGQYGYRRSEQRSQSPRPSEPFSGRGNANLPRQFQERPSGHEGGSRSQARSSGQGAFYRPMPSAAHNAWTKHRT